MGWYTTRWVAAADQDEPKAKALEILRGEPSLVMVPQGCGAKITWEEIELVEVSDVPDINPGFAFFEMENQARTKGNRVL